MRLSEEERDRQFGQGIVTLLGRHCDADGIREWLVSAYRLEGEIKAERLARDVPPETPTAAPTPSAAANRLNHPSEPVTSESAAAT